MIEAHLIGDREVIARFDVAVKGMPSGIARTVMRLSLDLTRLIQLKLSGQVLNVRSGVLRSSIHPMPVRQSATEVVGGAASTNVKYARIHEMGGTIHHPGGTPYEVISGRGAVFVSLKNAKAAFLPKTGPHDIRMPERSFMRSSLREMEPRIREELSATVSDILHT